MKVNAHSGSMPNPACCVHEGSGWQWEWDESWLQGNTLAYSGAMTTTVLSIIVATVVVLAILLLLAAWDRAPRGKGRGDQIGKKINPTAEEFSRSSGQEPLSGEPPQGGDRPAGNP